MRLTDSENNAVTDAATGNGPVNAICNAVDRAIGITNKLVDFNVQAATEGRDSLGTVTIRIEQDGKTYTGRGADTDIVVASAKAYLSAVNRRLGRRRVLQRPFLGVNPGLSRAQVHAEGAENAEFPLIIPGSLRISVRSSWNRARLNIGPEQGDEHGRPN